MTATNELLYAELDAITGGLDAFIDVSRNEVWKLEPYEPFEILALNDDSIQVACDPSDIPF